MLSKKFKKSNYKLQIIIKDEESMYYKICHLDKSLQNTSKKSTSIMSHQESPIRAVAEQCLKLLDLKQPISNDSKGFVCMMQRLVTDFKSQKSQQRSIKRTQSNKKSKQKSLDSSKGQTVFETNIEKNSKIQIVKKIKLKNPNFFLTGQRAELFQSLKRPQSFHDLKLRMKPTKRAETARLPQKQSSKQLSTNNSKRSFSRRSNVSSFNFKDYEQEYEKKLKLFLDFLFKVNFSNNTYIELCLRPVQQKMFRYRIFVGKGNNDKLVKQLLRRRFWYEVTSNQDQCHFYWTQFDLVNRHSQQQSSKYANAIEQHKGREVSNQITQYTLYRSPKFKIQAQKQVTELNNKFLKREDSRLVQKFITKESYLPFNKTFNFISLTNHIPGTCCITSKKNMLENIKKYYEDVLQENPFTIIPQSFHIMSLQSTQIDFFTHFAQLEPKKLWIIKPSENSSQGQGVQLFPAEQIKKRIKERWEEQKQTCSFIIQKYLQNPLLYYDRKFDIRHYMLLTCINGAIKAYWFRQGYIRTSSEYYRLVTKINCRNPLAKKFKNQFAQQQLKWLKNRPIHITNDVVQKQSKDYDKYEPGNKLSYNDFQKYLDHSFAEYPFFGRIVPKMKQIAKKVLLSVKGKIDPERKSSNFQLFGLDYILDEDFNVWLLEVNKNPCFENNSPVLDRVIPSLLQQTIRFCVDPLLPPKNHFPANQRHFLQSHSLAGLKFQLFYQQP